MICREAQYNFFNGELLYGYSFINLMVIIIILVLSLSLGIGERNKEAKQSGRVISPCRQGISL